MGSLLYKELYSHTCWKSCLLKSQSDHMMFSVMNKWRFSATVFGLCLETWRGGNPWYYSPIKWFNNSIEAPAWAVQAKVQLADVWGSCVTKLGLHLTKYFVTDKIPTQTLVYMGAHRNITELTCLLPCQAYAFWIVFIFTYECLPWCILELHIDKL